MTGVKIIGKNSIIGAGAVVIKNTPINSKMVGNPSRNINDN
jgi:acetyltransferase-like isoleucine patch superfamily enzyme